MLCLKERKMPMAGGMKDLVELLNQRFGDDGMIADDVVHTFVSARPAMKPLEEKNESDDA